jgi:hypothetical protein
MKITFADSFWKSLKTLNKHDTWWYKTYHVIIYDIPRFLKNIWLFRKALWNYRWWDYTFMLQFMKTGLHNNAVKLERYGSEIETSRIKKVDKMIRAAQLIENILDSNYINRAEEELGELQNLGGWLEGIKDTPKQQKHNRKVFNRADELEEQEWNELFEILKGQDHKQYSKFFKTFIQEEQNKQDIWNKWFDGSGIKNWWD